MTENKTFHLGKHHFLSPSLSPEIIPFVYKGLVIQYTVIPFLHLLSLLGYLAASLSCGCWTRDWAGNRSCVGGQRDGPRALNAQWSPRLLMPCRSDIPGVGVRPEDEATPEHPFLGPGERPGWHLWCSETGMCMSRWICGWPSEERIRSMLLEGSCLGG